MEIIFDIVKPFFLVPDLKMVVTFRNILLILGSYEDISALCLARLLRYIQKDYGSVIDQSLLVFNIDIMSIMPYAQN